VLRETQNTAKKSWKQKEIGGKRDGEKSPFGCWTARRRVLLVEIINVLCLLAAFHRIERELKCERIKLKLKIDA
jgi:hypothetical protein